MSRGTAKIVTNEGSGLYTITQVFFNVATGTYGTGNVGLVKADASDVALFAGYSVDDVVKFEIQETYDGLSRAVIWGSGGTVAGDEVWIHAVTAGDTTTVSHIGPDTSLSGYFIQITGLTGFVWDTMCTCKDAVCGIRIDIKGHTFAYAASGSGDWKNWPTGAPDYS